MLREDFGVEGESVKPLLLKATASITGIIVAPPLVDD
jgi:hypothetical protein